MAEDTGTGQAGGAKGDASAADEKQTTGEADWREVLPDDLKGAECLKPLSDVVALAKSYIHQQPMVGAGKLVVPGKDATQEEKDAFYTKLGRPESVDGYDLTETQVPENLPLHDDLVKRFLADAHSVGLTKKQTATLFNGQVVAQIDLLKGVAEQSTERVKEDEAALRKAFGQDYDKRTAAAGEAMLKFGSQVLLDKLEATGLRNDPDIVQAFAKVGKYLAEDSLVEGATSGFGMTPAEAKEAIQAKRLDPEFNKAHGDSSHPGHKAAVAEMSKLHDAAFPEPVKT